MVSELIIKTPSRLHLTLIDLNGSLGRIDGGVGLTLEKPALVLEMERNNGEISVEFQNRESIPVKIISDYDYCGDGIDNPRTTLEGECPLNCGLCSEHESQTILGLI
ncbi:MAG: hypothetical protein CVV29_12890, partial [Methanobacteriales archaeon HGW-Methanobacteriales-2]